MHSYGHGLDVLGAGWWKLTRSRWAKPRAQTAPHALTTVLKKALPKGPAPITVLGPKKVVISPRHLQSLVFTDAVKVAVTGGDRWTPPYDATENVWDSATTAEVVLKNGTRQSFTDLDMVATYGGDRVDVVLGAGDTTPKDDYAKTVEAEFQGMKKFAVLAGWPADLVPQITAIDNDWQDAKARANASGMSVVRIVPAEGGLRARIRDMTTALQARAPGGVSASAVGAGVGDYRGAATVRAVQERLHAVAAQFPRPDVRRGSLDPGKIDGKYGPRTASAVKAYQAYIGSSSVTGIIDQRVLTALGVSVPDVKSLVMVPQIVQSVAPKTQAEQAAATQAVEKVVARGGDPVQAVAAGKIAVEQVERGKSVGEAAQSAEAEVLSEGSFWDRLKGASAFEIALGGLGVAALGYGIYAVYKVVKPRAVPYVPSVQKA